MILQLLYRIYFLLECEYLRYGVLLAATFSCHRCTLTLITVTSLFQADSLVLRENTDEDSLGDVPTSIPVPYESQYLSPHRNQPVAHVAPQRIEQPSSPPASTFQVSNVWTTVIDNPIKNAVRVKGGMHHMLPM